MKNSILKKIAYSSVTKVIASILLTATALTGMAYIYMTLSVASMNAYNRDDMYRTFSQNVTDNYLAEMMTHFSDKEVYGDVEDSEHYKVLADSTNLSYAIINTGEMELEDVNLLDENQAKILYCEDGYVPDVKKDTNLPATIAEGQTTFSYNLGGWTSCFRGPFCTSYDSSVEYDEDGNEIEPDRIDNIYVVYKLAGTPSGVDYDSSLDVQKYDAALDYAWNLADTMTSAYAASTAVFIVCGIIILLLVIYLTAVSGCRSDLVGVKITAFDKIWLEVLIIAAISICGILYAILEAVVSSTDIQFLPVPMQLTIVLSIIAAAIFTCIGTWMSFVTRIKAKVLWENTFINKVGIKFLKFVFYPLKNMGNKLPILLKAMLICGAISLLELILMLASGTYNPEPILIFILLKAVEFVTIAFIVMHLSRMRDGIKKVAGGDYSAQVDMTHMVGDFKDAAMDINCISFGMNDAVEEQMKSERMKTQLITNVSHDIKTPLTSIINYVDLLQKEDIKNEKAIEYMEVLHRQSLRLKKLIEDLIEASKASSGAIDMTMSEIDTHVVISQLMGEYSDKAKAAKVDLVISQPDKPAKIMADGRYLWRVFDNVLSNICKYSMANTRAYVDIVKNNGQVVMTFKNISSEALNISPEELLERFVRGDESRNKEGNGLGLAIARDLTAQMNGTFDLQVDGDLFKAIISFPAV